MHRNKYSLLFAVFVLVLASLACGTSSGDGGDDTGGAAAPIRQWASSAVASSEYGTTDWNAGQATGAPNTAECGDQVTAWASSSYSGFDWIEVSFVTPVVPTQINIHESYTPGQIVKVEVRDEGGSYHIVWQGTGAVVEQCPRVFTVNVTDITVRVTAVRITVDQSIGVNWDEIDAVELIGAP
jgi:hypothetical protein